MKKIFLSVIIMTSCLLNSTFAQEVTVVTTDRKIYAPFSKYVEVYFTEQQEMAYLLHKFISRPPDEVNINIKNDTSLRNPIHYERIWYLPENECWSYSITTNDSVQFDKDILGIFIYNDGREETRLSLSSDGRVIFLDEKRQTIMPNICTKIISPRRWFHIGLGVKKLNKLKKTFPEYYFN